jgi:hypothetical protein
MNQLYSSGLIFDVVLSVIGVELLVLVAYRLLSGRQLVALDVYANLMAAAGLLGAMHAYVAGAWWGHAGLLLTVALIAHLTGLRLRWRTHVSRRAATRYDDEVSQVQFSGGR